MTDIDWHDRLWYRCVAYGEEVNDGTYRTDGEIESLIASYFPPDEEPEAFQCHLNAFREGRKRAAEAYIPVIGAQWDYDSIRNIDGTPVQWDGDE
jgi:hypothetical protein